MSVRLGSRPPRIRLPYVSTQCPYLHHRRSLHLAIFSSIPHTLHPTHSTPQTTLNPTQKRTIRTLPIGKRKHPKHSRFNNHPSLPTLDSTPLGAYNRRLRADTLPLRTGALAVKRGMTAIYVDASGLQAGGTTAADPAGPDDVGNKPPNTEAGANSNVGKGAQSADGAGGPSRAKRDKAGTARESFAVLGGKPAVGGVRVPATVLQLDRCQVVATKTREKHGYFAVVVGEGWRKPKRVGKAMMGVFANARMGEMTVDAKRAQEKLARREGREAEEEVEEEEEAEGEETKDVQGLPPKREIREFKVKDAKGLLPVGASILPTHFQVGQYVDARANTRGMGFAGGMKRHGFKGQPASHGVSLTHRSMGSAGGGQGSGSRVHPGKKMPGNMGGQQHTVQNLKVLMVDEHNGLVVVSGAISGRKGDLVMLCDAIKKPWPTINATA